MVDQRLVGGWGGVCGLVLDLDFLSEELNWEKQGYLSIGLMSVRRFDGQPEASFFRRRSKIGG